MLAHPVACRTLLAQGKMASLSTHSDAYPYGSLVQYAADAQGNPLLLLSELAEHTQNLKGDPHASLLVWQTNERVDPLASGRVSLLGQIEAHPEGLPLYLDRHPQAQRYAGFKDFACWRLRVERLRYVGGFGRMSWVDLSSYQQAQPDPVSQFAERVIEHMNEDHQDALVQILAKHLGRAVEQAVMVGCDGAGYAVRVDGSEVVELAFANYLTTSDEVRREFIRQVQAARG